MTRNRFVSGAGSSLALATLLCVLPSARLTLVAAPPPAPVRVDVAGAPAGSLLAIALNGGKVAEVSIAADGTGSSILDLTNLGKVQVDVYVKVCNDGRTELVLYTDGGTPPEDRECRNRKVGAFWWGKTHRVTVNVRTFSFSTPGSLLNAKTIGIGAAALGGSVALAAGGGGSSSPTNASNNPTPSNTPAPSGGGGGTGTTPSFGFANGAWRNTLTLQTDPCGGFAQSANTTATVSVDTTTGNGTIVHVHPSATLNYTATTTRTSDTAGTVTGTGTVTFGTMTYRLTLVLQISGSNASVTESFVRTAGGSSCETRYAGNGTK